MRCRLLPHSSGDGPANMAMDTALLDAEPTAAVLRTYGWIAPTLSLGYFQTIAEKEADARWRDVPIVRRPSGGGALWHDRELTYALIVPRTHPLARRPSDLYRTVHAAIAQAMNERGIAASSRAVPAASEPRSRPFLCFLDRDPEDLLVSGSKVVGSAQRRRPGAVLQHGSILLGRSSRTPELPGLAELAGAEPAVDQWASLIREALPKALGLDPIGDQLTDEELSRAEVLAQEVYRGDRWTFRR